MAKKKKAKRKVSVKTEAKRIVKKAERKAKPLGRKVKRGAKRVGKKAAKFAKTDTGRAGIGAGAGALLLGPVGAVAGAAAGLATRNPGGRKRNVSSFEPGRGKPVSKKGKSSKIKGLPSPGKKLVRIGLREQDKLRMALEKTQATSNPQAQIKVSSLIGNMLLDYHKASPAIEHVAASALRGERVPLSIVKRARNDLRSLYKIQTQAAEREQIRDIAQALNSLIAKREHSMAKKNPVRAFSLDTQIKRQRQSRAKKTAMGMSRDSKVYGEVKKKSLAARLRKINPGHPEWNQRYSMLNDLATNYRKSRQRWISVSTKASSTDAAVSRAQKRMDDAENKLILYADMVDLSPKDLKLYLAKHQQQKRSRARANPSRPVHLTQGKKRLKIAEESLKKGRKTGGLQVLLRASNAAAVAHSEFMNAGEVSGKNIELAHKIYDEAAGLIESKCLSSSRMQPMMNPGIRMRHIPPHAKKAKIREVVGRNIAKLSESKDPRTDKSYKQQQAIAIALTQAREDAQKRTAQKRLLTRMYGKAPSNPSKNPLVFKKSSITLRHVPKNATLQKIRNVVMDNVYTIEKRYGKSHNDAMKIAVQNIYDDIPNVSEKTARLIRLHWPDPNLSKSGQEAQYKRWKKLFSNPLAHIPKGAGIRKIRNVVSKNIATEMGAGKPQRQAVAIAIRSAQEDADRVGGTTAKLIRSEYPKRNPKKATKEDLRKIQKKRERALKGAAVGTAVGGLTGVSVGGPPGAIVGGAAGSYLGAKVAGVSKGKRAKKSKKKPKKKK